MNWEIERAGGWKGRKRRTLLATETIPRTERLWKRNRRPSQEPPPMPSLTPASKFPSLKYLHPLLVWDMYGEVIFTFLFLPSVRLIYLVWLTQQLPLLSKGQALPPLAILCPVLSSQVRMSWLKKELETTWVRIELEGLKTWEEEEAFVNCRGFAVNVQLRCDYDLLEDYNQGNQLWKKKRNYSATEGKWIPTQDSS